MPNSHEKHVCIVQFIDIEAEVEHGEESSEDNDIICPVLHLKNWIGLTKLHIYI
jgi:hypothetical protein